MNILITGAAGFIGSHAADWFTKNEYGVVVLDSFTYASNIENTEGFYEDAIAGYDLDINENKQVVYICKHHNIDWIINFAAETHVDNSIESCSEFIWSNILGVSSLLDACRETGTKLFHISTDEVYGDIESGSFCEQDRLLPKNPYSATKASAENFIIAYSNTYGIEYLMARPSNNYGPRQHKEKLLPKMITNLLNDDKVPIYGDGKNIREWTYVKDTVKAIEHILNNSPINETYNISSNIEKQNIEMVEMVCIIMNKNSKESIEYVEDRLGHDFRYSIDCNKLLDIGFKFDSDIEKNIKETVESYNGNS